MDSQRCTHCSHIQCQYEMMIYRLLIVAPSIWHFLLYPLHSSESPFSFRTRRKTICFSLLLTSRKASDRLWFITHSLNVTNVTFILSQPAYIQHCMLITPLVLLNVKKQPTFRPICQHFVWHRQFQCHSSYYYRFSQPRDHLQWRLVLGYYD